MTDTTPPLTAERVRQMPAGREMDLRVAVAVGAMTPDALAFLGDPKMMAYLDRQDADGSYPAPAPPRYSTADVVLIIGHVLGREYGKVKLDGSHYHDWYCWLGWGPGLHGEGESGGRVFGLTMGEAVCRAFLLATLEHP